MVDRGIANLTKREKDCLRLLLGARTAKQVAIELKLSPATVEGYLKSARGKLGVSDSGDAARIFAAFDTPQKLGDEPTTLVPSAEVGPFGPAPALVDRREHAGRTILYRFVRMLFPPIERQPNALDVRSRLNLVLVQVGLITGISLVFILAFYVFGWALIRLITGRS